MTSEAVITKEICDANGCPLAPPNCEMFFLNPPDSTECMRANSHNIWFSPTPEHRDGVVHWSCDESFPLLVCNARGGIRKIIAAVAFEAWDTELHRLLELDTPEMMGWTVANEMTYAWREWALADPDEDEDDDDDLPVVFKEPTNESTQVD